MITYFLFLAGFILLTYGASFLVDGASAIAKKFNISDLVIGLTIVALGTSLPELIVSLLSSSHGSSDIAIGNVLGSNIFNTLMIVGLAALIYPLSVQSATVKVEIPLGILAAVIVGLMANDFFIGKEFSIISRADGAVLLLFFSGFLFYTFISVRQNKEVDLQEESTETINIPKALLRIIAGLFGLVIGGQWIVNGAIELARTLEISESIIGLTIVAAGTSLPELATSAVASFKRNSDIAIGNVVGSNIFNLFFILGTSSLVQPLSPSPHSNVDIGVTISSGILLMFFTYIGKKNRKISRFEGFLFLILYIGYVIYLIGRG